MKRNYNHGFESLKRRLSLGLALALVVLASLVAPAAQPVENKNPDGELRLVNGVCSCVEPGATQTPPCGGACELNRSLAPSVTGSANGAATRGDDCLPPGVNTHVSGENCQCIQPGETLGPPVLCVN